MSKQFLAILVAIVLIFVGIIAFGGKPNNSGSGSSSGSPTQHVEGQGKAGVTLVEYGDYECPFCGDYYPTVKQVQADMDQQIFFQFRNFPLVSIHQNAFAGARAAEAAGLENKFWEMHDLLYQNQSQWSGAGDPTAFFNQYAQQLGLNLARFKADYASAKVNNLVNADMAVGNKLGISGTPTFYLDGKELNNNQLIDSRSQPSVAAFEAVINAEIAKKAKPSNSTNSTSQTPASQ